MAILVLLYHATPRVAADYWDVPLETFKRQIDRLQKDGAAFVPFGSLRDRSLLEASRTYVAITFDDGHVSNAQAVESLSALGVRPTLFVVRNWSETGTGVHGAGAYLRREELRALVPACDLGSHGTTHRNLTGLAPAELTRELQLSREYVGEITSGAADTMALPNGKMSPEVLAAARDCGFRLVRGSTPDVNTQVHTLVSAACVNASHDVSYPARLARRSRAIWAARRARRLALAPIRALLSHDGEAPKPRDAPLAPARLSHDG